MPELPEVETVRRQLQSSVVGKTISGVLIKEPSVIRNHPQELRNILTGKSITDIKRIGKLLQFELNNNMVLLAHLKMTGQFLYQQSGEIKAGIYPLLYASTSGGKKAAGKFREEQAKEGANIKHTHVLFQFEDGSVLAFRDVRKFGYLMLVSQEERLKTNEKYGIDPLSENFTREHFHHAFEHRQKSVKAILMDQALIAGIGNIYADEICHMTHLKPKTSAAHLKKKQLDDLYYACSEIIQRAVQHKGTTFRDFSGADGEPGNFSFELKAYGRAGEKCLQCPNGVIKKITYLGRGTHYCMNCQK